MEKLDNAEVTEVYKVSQTDPVKSSEIEMLPLKPKLDSEEDTFVPEKQTWTLQNWLYPPELPRSCQLLRKENLAIPACYLLVGILQGLIGPLINVYPLDLGATEAQYSTISSLRSLPATFKLAFGFLSDNFPIYGYKRKSFMMLGWLMASLSMGVLLLVSDLSLQEDEFVNDEGELDNRIVAPENAPSIPLLSLTTLLFGTGFWMADVMGDSVVAEKAKLEPENARGSVQSSCYSYRFFGLMVAAPFSTSIYSWLGPRYIILLLSTLPLIILPLVYWLQEEKNAPIAPTSAQCKEIWNTVRSRAVWQPLGFVYLYNVLQVGNVAWKEYLKTTLGFTAAQLNSIYVVACVLLYVGVVVYKYYLINWSWRTVYVVTTVLNGVFSFLQVLLILGITFGLSNFVFALGDDAFAELIGGIQFLPTTIMMVHLCPDGSEGASYAMFTTVNNSALNLSAAISTQLLRIWDVSKDALARHDLSGMINLTILTSLIQISGLGFVGLLPKTREDLLSLKERQFGTSNLGGAIFLSITFLSILYSLIVSLLNIIYPGWMGES